MLRVWETLQPLAASWDIPTANQVKNSLADAKNEMVNEMVNATGLVSWEGQQGWGDAEGTGPGILELSTSWACSWNPKAGKERFGAWPSSCPMAQPPALTHSIPRNTSFVFCLISAENTIQTSWEYNPFRIRAFYFQVDFHTSKYIKKKK